MMESFVVKIGLRPWAKYAIYAGVILGSQRIIDTALKYGVVIK